MIFGKYPIKWQNFQWDVPAYLETEPGRQHALLTGLRFLSCYDPRPEICGTYLHVPWSVSVILSVRYSLLEVKVLDSL